MASLTSNIPHPALLASQHLTPALKSFWPTFKSYFLSGKYGNTPLGLLTAARLYYARADPFHTAIWICVYFSTLVYVTQKVTGNASQVDRLWTFLPPIYSVHFTFQKLLASILDPPKVAGLFSSSAAKGSSGHIVPRLALILFLQSLWSARLTFHAVRRGFFSKGEEDYRWPVLRERMPGWVWEIFSLTFIAVAQNILLALTALPQYMILTSTWHTFNKGVRPASQLTVWDWLIAGLTIINLSFEMLSDQQQWIYQNYKRGNDAKGQPLPAAKKKTIKDDPDVQRGFLTRGLWAYSRHPNFFFEQINWWLFWTYVVITFAPENALAKNDLRSLAKLAYVFLSSYATLSPILMNILFISSTAFTEEISGGKYPAYKSYQKRVAMFVPFETIIRGVWFREFESESTTTQIEQDVWGKVSVATLNNANKKIQ